MVTASVILEMEVDAYIWYKYLPNLEVNNALNKLSTVIH